MLKEKDIRVPSKEDIKILEQKEPLYTLDNLPIQGHLITSDEIQKEKLDEENSFQELYKKLSVEVSKENYVKYKDNGREFIGYQAQYAIDLLNEVVGLGKWHTICEIRKEEFINKGWAVAGGLTILINWNGHDFAVNGFGGSFAKDIANAYKGFKTSAFKNACRYLGIGRELYAENEEDIIETSSPETLPEVSQTDNELANKIDACKTVSELETLKDSVQAAEGEAVKKVLLKKYNEKKIFLIEADK
jgi:hypothetical protein